MRDWYRVKKIFFQDAVRLLSIIWKASPIYFIYEVLDALIKAALPFVFILIPKYVIDELMGERRLMFIFAFLLSILLGYGILEGCDRWIMVQKNIYARKVKNAFLEKFYLRILRMDYSHLEDPAIIEQKGKAIRPIRNMDAINEFIKNFFLSMQYGLSLIGLISILSSLNFLVIIVLLLLIWFSVSVQTKIIKCEDQFEEEMAMIDRRYDYYDNLASDEIRAKDVRLYQMKTFLMNKIRQDNTHVLGKYFNQLYKNKGRYAVLAEAINQLQNIFIYGYVSWNVFAQRITIGAMTMYISSAAKLVSNVSVFINSLMLLEQNCRFLSFYLRFADSNERSIVLWKDDILPCFEQIDTITFDHVWFRYPNQSKYALQDVSFTIHKAEKVSIVGENGSGKTTLVKLLCRFYMPERGKILINGICIQQLDLVEYQKIISGVFQDFKLFSFTLKQNLTFDRVINMEMIDVLLDTVGLRKKVVHLPKGLDTYLYKNFEEDGVVFSGGEEQKFAIVRSAYQGNISKSQILILDEPSAALDPYAEKELYEYFEKLSDGKIAFFISHRLSSCQFCDRILVMQQGKIKENGSHLGLLKQNGLYASLWNTQAKQYDMRYEKS